MRILTRIVLNIWTLCSKQFNMFEMRWNSFLTKLFFLTFERLFFENFLTQLISELGANNTESLKHLIDNEKKKKREFQDIIKR